jgi:hypothetical protein
MNQTEIIAQAVVEAAISGSRMVYHSDQSQSVPDFDLYYPDSRVASLEVTASVDVVDLETQAAISSRRKGGPRVKAELCRKAWRIRPASGANVNKIRANVDSYLSPIESSGIEHFFSSRDRRQHPTIDRISTDLHVSHGDVLDGWQPGYISIALPIGGSFVDASLVSDAVEFEAFKLDNRQKLSAAGTTERHLFVFVDVLNHRVWTPLVDLVPPAEAPDLPQEVTHVWAVGPARSANDYVVWRADAGSGWSSLGSIAIELLNQA